MVADTFDENMFNECGAKVNLISTVAIKPAVDVVASFVWLRMRAVDKCTSIHPPTERFQGPFIRVHKNVGRTTSGIWVSALISCNGMLISWGTHCKPNG